MHYSKLHHPFWNKPINGSLQPLSLETKISFSRTRNMSETTAVKVTRGFIKFVILYLDLIGRVMFGILHWNYKSKKLPPITNMLLIESASSLALKIRKREVTSEEITRLHIERIKQINPLINAVVDTRFDEAIEEAKAADEILRAHPELEDEFAKDKPFFGVPMTIKESFQVTGLHQTAGMYSRKDIVSIEDATCVRHMKKAGAIIMAVTNVPEICMWWETYNNVYGQTNNPYNLSRIAGGSSGGEGAIISACGSPMGLGSDIGGSIRMPSYFNGIFGHKATTGVVDNSGQEPLLSGQLHLYASSGPLCRRACDLKPMLKVFTGSKVNLLSLDKKVNFRNLKIYYMEDDTGSVWTTPVDSEIKQAIERTIDYFKTTYNTPCEQLNLTQFRSASDMFYAKIYGDKDAYSICSQLDKRESEINVWLEWIKYPFGFSHYTGSALFNGVIEKFAAIHRKSSMYKLAMKEMEELKNFFAEKFTGNEIFIYPPNPNEALYHRQTFFKGFNSVYTSIFNILGLPATVCPLGLNSNGLPCGVQVVAGLHQDHLCLSVAEELERTFGGWVCPSALKE